jgi:hypothetical protein
MHPHWYAKVMIGDDGSYTTHIDAAQPSQAEDAGKINAGLFIVVQITLYTLQIM